jgi:L-alanine-DL-glutamate epimerase-like enolase superfamily enzyme
MAARSFLTEQERVAALSGQMITQARVHELRYGISPPLRLPAGPVPSREYVVLELILADGSIGTAYVLTRGAPIYDAARSLAASLIGRPLRSAVAGGASQRGTAPLQRAWSLADICAWDLLGKTANLPTWKLLSTEATPRRALAVAGYRRAGESPERFGGRLHGLAEAGITAVKIAAGATDIETAELLAAVRAHEPKLGLVVDMGFAAHSVSAALESIQVWRQYELAWVEDPFPPHDAAAIAAVRASGTGVLIGAGDEAPPSALYAMLEQDAVDLIRMDATTTGGLTGLLELAHAADRRISLHIYPEVHCHIATAFPAVEEVELFLPADPFDFVDQFILADGFDIDPGGDIAPPNAPGLGLSFDRERAVGNISRQSHH